MPNHPNRGARTAASTPTPDEVRAFRDAHNLSARAAGALVHVTARAWQLWECGPADGGRRMHPAFFELARIKARRLRA